MSKIRTVFGLLAALAAALWSFSAAAQSNCQYIAPNAVLTAGQWNSCFAAKQDAIGFTPINPGNIQGIAPITFALVSGVYDIGLATDSNFVVNGSNQLALASAVKITTSLTVPSIIGGVGSSSSVSIAGSSAPGGGDQVILGASVVRVSPAGFASGTANLAIGTAGVAQGQIVLASPTANSMIIMNAASATGTATIPSGTYTFSGTQLNETFSGLKIFTGGATGTPSSGQASFGGASSSGAVLIGNGSSTDFALQNSANNNVCNVVHATQTLTCTALALSSPLAIAQGGTGQVSASAAIAALMPTPTRAGDIAYWNGSIWTTLPGNNSGTQILTENSSGVPSWAATGSVSSVTIAGAGGMTTSGTCTVTTSGTCTLYDAGGFLNVLRNASFSAWFHGCVASACTISPQFSVTAAVSNGGACEITISNTATFTTGELVPVSGIAGATGCNGTWIVTVTNGTQLTLQGTTFGGSYTSGGTAGGGFCAEGVFVIPTGAAVTCQQTNQQANGAPYFSMKITGATSVTDVIVRFVVESNQTEILSSQNATFQLYWINNTGGSVTPTLQTKYANNGAQDNWGATTTDLAATNMQACGNGSGCHSAYTLAVSNLAVFGYEFNVDFGNNFSTTGKTVTLFTFDARVTPAVSTGANSNPPPIEIHDPAGDTHWNERFYQISYENGTAPGSSTTTGLVGGTSCTSTPFCSQAWLNFRTPMRCAPVLATWDGAGNAAKMSTTSGGSGTTFTNNVGPNVAAALATSKGFMFSAAGSSVAGYEHYAADCSITGG